MFWRWDYIYKSCLWWIPILIATYNISEEKMFMGIASQIIVENVKFET